MKINAGIDFIHGGRAFGSVAQRLQRSGMNINALRTCATLRKDEWKQYDVAVVKAAQQRLVGVADLISRGLTYSITNGMGKTVLEYEEESDPLSAQLSMDAITRGRSDRPEWTLRYLPLPIIHADYTINARSLAASRTTGDPLDTTMAERAGRKVAELAEEILFMGYSSYSFGGGTIYGYTDFPDANLGSIGTSWATDTGANILTDVLAMKQASINDRHYGPWVLYIPTAFEVAMDKDYDTSSGRVITIRQRILEVAGIQDIKVIDKLTGTRALLVEMNSETVRLVQGMPVTTVEWDSEGGMVHHYKVMAIMVPQLRSDFQQRCGIVHYS
jgi:hypothetical protein